MIPALLLFLLQQSTQIPFIHHPVPQPEESRTYIDLSFNPVRIIKPDSVFRPRVIRLTEENIYVLDYSPFVRVLKLDEGTGEILTAYGKQRGSGPGDTGNPTDFAVTKNGDVWIADPTNSRLSVFNPEGDPETVILHKELPYKISGSQSSNTVVLANLESTKSYLVEKNEKIHWETGELTENPPIWNNIVSGFTILLDQNEAVKVGNYAGYIIRYNHKGELKYIRKTIEHNQNPVGKSVRGVDQLIYNINRQHLNYAVASGFTYKDKLVLFVQHMGEDKFQSLDVYKLSDGSCQYSYRLPESFRDIDMTENGMFAGIKPDGEIVIWEVVGF